MALFFDQEWFDARLALTGSTREDLGRLLRLSTMDVSELWKDQRELSAADVLSISRFLNASVEEVARRAGVSTPVPQSADLVDERLAKVEIRLDRIEQAITDLLSALASKAPR